MSEVSNRYERVGDGFGSRLRRITPEQWAVPTPCSEWDVRELVAHVIATHGRMVANLESSPPQEVDAAEDLTVHWPKASAAVRAALADPDRASRTVSGMFGEQSFESLVGRLLCADTLFHTWDLARATGQEEQLDPEAVAKAMEFLVPLDEAIRRPGGFAPKIDPPADADPQTRLLNFGGRAVQ
ncbi:MAG: TIGR03086 family metal-binding protein [Actinomycetota bacterium]|nr:TIGR03086 family metal-binding protein [Actinomycetota bacterium]